MPHDPLTTEIEWLTRGVRAIRIARFGDGKADEMPLELKGLKGNMMKLHRRIDTLNQLASAGDTKGGELEKALTEVGTQLASHLDDLTFAATMLGNGSGDSQEGQEKPKEPPAVQQPEPPPPNPEPPQAPQSAIKAAPMEFHG